METLLSKILVVTSPAILPNDHVFCIDSLCRKHQLVIFMHFGDEKYEIPGTFLLPYNARMIHYDYETLDEALGQIEIFLKSFGVEMVSRHRHEDNPLPFVLGGSILQVPTDVQLSFFDGGVPDAELRTVVNMPKAEWDL